MSHRRARAAHEIRSRIAEIIERDVSDPRLQALSVVEVKPSPDLSFARVYYRVYDHIEEVGRALQKAKPFIRRRLAEALTLRRVPELDFRLDTSEERAERIEDILRSVKPRDEISSSGGGEEPS